MADATISWISGPVLRARCTGGFRLSDAILVGDGDLLGEVIRVSDDGIVAQVYEDTTGLRPGDRVIGMGAPLSIRLRPGLPGRIFDGLLRPLADMPGYTLQSGVKATAPERLAFEPIVTRGDQVGAGQVIGTAAMAHFREKVLCPPDVSGEVVSVVGIGEYADDEALCELRAPSGETVSLTAGCAWPIRRPRPVKRRLPHAEPLVTGQRIIDMLFPVARGGSAMLPGGFGTGKTVLQENLAKWCDADVIVYVGCGERGNEMTHVLDEFPELEDPRTGRPLMERTIIIANTSNMPVAAREASVYTGITLAEYWRDQGLKVALMADSTSRWAEAMREISSRLEEMPAEEGYPSYLSSRLAAFYERAARVVCLG
ncbi:MAG TPA: V-type ATP synthase subunit A, partial [Woeseiaceae bacterium]